MINFHSQYPFVRVNAFEQFEAPKDKYYPLTVAYSLGAEVYSQENQDKDTHVWVAYADNADVYLYREDQGINTAVKVFTAPAKIMQLDLAMDQLNNPQFTYCLSDGSAYLYWFNLTTWETVILPYLCPKIMLDHYKIQDAPLSDICIFACWNGKLYVATQRYSYSDWTQIADSTTAGLLWRVGHTKSGSIGVMWR